MQFYTLFPPFRNHWWALQWLALTSSNYSQIAVFSALNRTFSTANEKRKTKTINEIAGKVKGKRSHCPANFSTFVPKSLFYISIENKNECICSKLVIELSEVQFWSEICILVISNRTRALRSFDSETALMISDQIHSTQCNYHNWMLLDFQVDLAFCSDLTPYNFTFLLHLKTDHLDCEANIVVVFNLQVRNKNRKLYWT